MSQNRTSVSYSNATEFLPNSGLTFDEIRNKVKALRIAKDLLTASEQHMLTMLEDLLHVVDNPGDPF